MSAESLDLEKLHEIIATYNEGISESDLIPILQKTQDAYGYLPRTTLEEISNTTSIPRSKIFGVVTFYAQFSMIPRGRHTIRICSGTACHVKGAMGLREKVQQILGIEEGQTTQDYKFSLESVPCFGTCSLAPVIKIDERYYGKLSPEKTEEIIKTY
jgi:NADH-quinone oxidoreductase subunit E